VLRQENEGATGHGKLRGHRKPQNLAYDVWAIAESCWKAPCS
jgi:hypothetical protein